MTRRHSHGVARPAIVSFAPRLVLPALAAMLGLGLSVAAEQVSPADADRRAAGAGAAGPPAGGIPTTRFTYQGELTQGGAPADGTFPMSFTLWDAASGGTQVGGPVAFPGVSVEGGRFAVELDFGADALGAGPRWLEIEVDGFLLSPRQAITPVPYAVRTRGIDVSDAGAVGIGVTASPSGTSRLRVWEADGTPGTAIEALSSGGAAVEAVRQQGGGPAVSALHFGEEGTGVRAVTSAGSRIGELATPEAAVRGVAADTANDWAAWFEGRSYLGERAFVGREGPITPAEVFGVRAVAEGYDYGGMYVALEGELGRPFYGYAIDGVPRAWTTYDPLRGQWQVELGGQPRFRVDEHGARSATGGRMPVASAVVSDTGQIIGDAGFDALAVFADDGYLSGFGYLVLLKNGESWGDQPSVQVTLHGTIPFSPPVPHYRVVDDRMLEVFLIKPDEGTVPGSFSITIWPDVD